ncbi:MAG: hypothetical protein AAB691_03815 [Patescibacteria group bacterium]
MDILGIVGKAPGGFPILFGGTRQTIKMSRVHQMPLEGLVDPANCVFCKMEPAKVAEETHHIPGVVEPRGWRRLKNAFTPHPDHRLIIPEICWSPGDLQEWGGTSGLYSALIMAAAEAGDGNEKVFLVNVGKSAGQNQGHPHMHVFSGIIEGHRGIESTSDFATKATHVASDNSFDIFAAGIHSGECQILPRESDFDLKKTLNLHALASAMSHLVRRCNRAFASEPMPIFVDVATRQAVVSQAMKPDQVAILNERSLNGELKFELRQLPPPWSMAVRVSGEGKLLYASYAPDLHCGSALERCVSIFERVPFVLPWPHEMTAEHLRSFYKSQPLRP